MKKRLLSLILAICILFSLAAAVSAADQSAPQYMPQAVLLNELGLLKGAGKNADGSINYALPRSATRIEGLILLLRLLGEEDEALAYTGECPFTDLSGNNARYASYAREKGYTKGVSATRFDNSPLLANAFLTFVMRALGYTDVDYNTAFAEAGQIGLIHRGEFTDQSSAILRDDCVKICYNALLTDMADGSGTLLQALSRRGKVQREAAGRLLAAHSTILPATDVDLMAWQRGFIASLDQQYLKQAPYYGLPEDISFDFSPDSLDDFENNVIYAFLIGDYSLCFCFDNAEQYDVFSTWFERDFTYLCCRHPDLFGAVCNQYCQIVPEYVSKDSDDVCCIMEIDPETNPPLTLEQAWANQQASLKEADRIHDLLHEKGYIHDGMTEKEIAKAIGDYLLTLKIQLGLKNKFVTAKTLGTTMLYDSSYACLVNRRADCVGRAAAFSLLCHLEGIRSYGVSGFMYQNAELGHEMNRVILDGSEYIYDWYNHLPFVTVDQLRNIFLFDKETLSD